METIVQEMKRGREVDTFSIGQKSQGQYQGQLETTTCRMIQKKGSSEMKKHNRKSWGIESWHRALVRRVVTVRLRTSSRGGVVE